MTAQSGARRAADVAFVVVATLIGAAIVVGMVAVAFRVARGSAGGAP